MIKPAYATSNDEWKEKLLRKLAENFYSRLDFEYQSEYKSIFPTFVFISLLNDTSTYVGYLISKPSL